MSTDSQPDLGPPRKKVFAAGGDSIPTSIGKYQIQRKIGAGGMGVVYLALDPEFNRLVALKVLREDRAENPSLVKRFYAEAKTAAALKHKNIVAVYDAGRVDNQTYIAMEFVDGIDVHDLVQRREMIPVRRSIDIVKQVAQALQHAQERGVVHREIKPSNLLIQRDGTVKLADLGLARIVDESSEAAITRDGTTVGTVDYMSPEQARGSRNADVRSDIYSLGCAWYHMLTGEPPYSHGSLTQRLRLHAEGNPPDPRVINKNVPEGIVAILNHMMAKRPEDRYPSPAALLADLEKVGLSRKNLSEEILSGFDDSELNAPVSVKPAAKTRVMPEQKPRKKTAKSLEDIEDAEESSVPFRLIFTVAAIIGAVALMVIGYGYWKGQPTAQPAGGGVATDPFGQDDPFGLESAGPAPSNPAPPKSTPEDPPANNILRGTEPPQNKQEPEAENPQKDAQTAPSETPPKVAEAPNGVTHRQHLPEWAAEPLSRNRLAQLTAENDSSNKNDPAASNGRGIKKYLDDLPPAGGILELPGPGIYRFDVDSLSGYEHLVIRGSGKQRPTLLLKPQTENSSIVQVSGEILELERLDLFIDLKNSKGQKITAFQLGPGDVYLRECSLQLLGDSKVPVTALGVIKDASASITAATRLLVERTALIGEQLTAIDSDTDATEIVVLESLIAVGEVPAVRLTQSRAAAAKSSRTFHWIADTVVSEMAAVELVNELSTGRVAPLSVIAVDTLFANPSPSEKAALLKLRNWPFNASQPTGLSWESAGSAYQGWPKLALQRSSTKIETVAADYSRWKTLWREPGEASQFHPEAWPATPVSQGSPPRLKTFDPKTLPNKEAVGVHRALPGSPLEGLSIGAPSSLKVTRRPLPARPGPPHWMQTEFDNAETITVDLSKQDLGTVLNDPKLPKRAVILAKGFGRRSVSPCVINNRSIRVQIKETSSNTPLVLVLKRSRGRPAESDENAALLTIDGGRLEIINGRFELDSVGSQASSGFFLDARNGEFSLDHCHVTSLARDGAAAPLIRWRIDQAASAERGSVIRNSFLAAGENLISAHLRSSQLRIDNSILVTGSTLFQIGLEGKAAELTSLVAAHSTFSAADCFFSIEGEAPSEPVAPLFAVFADHTIFGPPASQGQRSAGPILMRVTRSLAPAKVVEWIGNHIGYSTEIGPFLVEEAASTPASRDFESNWLSRWGKERVNHALCQPGGVLFAQPLPELANLKVTNFALNPSAAALHWGNKKTPLGAELGSIKSP